MLRVSRGREHARLRAVWPPVCLRNLRRAHPLEGATPRVLSALQAAIQEPHARIPHVATKQRRKAQPQTEAPRRLVQSFLVSENDQKMHIVVCVCLGLCVRFCVCVVRTAVPRPVRCVRYGTVWAVYVACGAYCVLGVVPLSIFYLLAKVSFLRRKTNITQAPGQDSRWAPHSGREDTTRRTGTEAGVEDRGDVWCPGEERGRGRCVSSEEVRLDRLASELWPTVSSVSLAAREPDAARG